MSMPSQNMPVTATLRSTPLVLRHRLVANYQASGEGVTVDDMIRRITEEIPEPRYGR